MTSSIISLWFAAAAAAAAGLETWLYVTKGKNVSWKDDEEELFWKLVISTLFSMDNDMQVKRGTAGHFPESFSGLTLL